MAILKNVWRFQCDPADGDADPTVQVFLKRTVTVDGEEMVVRDTTPIPMRFSELAGGLPDLLDIAKISAKAESIKSAEVALLAEKG